MEEWLLLLAFHLSILTYYLGTLIYALPIPWRSLKRWGPEMIYDGAASATLVFAFTLIVTGIEYLRAVAGGGWDEFYAWITGRLGTIVSYQMLISTLAAAMSSASGFSLGSLFWPHLRMLSQAAIVLNTLAALGLVIQRYHVRMLALGIMLYAVPFKAARTAGAALMAFTVVFYVALPLMPLFVESLSTAPIETPPRGEAEWGVSFARIYVWSQSTQPLPEAQLLIEVDGKTIALYPTDKDGMADASSPDRGLPGVPFKVKVEYSGLVFRASPEPVDPSMHIAGTAAYNVLNLTVPSLLCLPAPHRPIALEDPSPRIGICRISLSNGTIHVNMTLATTGGTLYLVLLKGDSLANMLVNGTAPSHVVEPWSWRGMQGFYHKVILPPGTHVVEAEYELSGKGSPQLEDKPYLKAVTKGGIDALADKVARIIFSWLLLPIAFLAILLLATYSLAYTLGGRGRIRIPLGV